MASDAKAIYPPIITDDADKKRLVQAVSDWSITNGLVVKPPPTVASAGEGILATPVPVTLFPSPFPNSCYQEARSLQTRYNRLYANISRDDNFLAGIVREVAGGDDFVAKLWDVHERCKSEGYVQDLSLGLFRSDYMIHQDGQGLSIKQVEFNTIAASFGGLSSQTTKLHRFLADTVYPFLGTDGWHEAVVSAPENKSTAGLVAGLGAAYHAYHAHQANHPLHGHSQSSCILFVVQDDERNISDQRQLEYALHEMGILAVRVALHEVGQQVLVGSNRKLCYRPPGDRTGLLEVAVVYYRAGYGPDDYTDSRSWQARFLLERSAAIKCPSVLTQLAGMKKVQQVLATLKGGAGLRLLQRFVPDEKDALQLFRTFTNIYPMDTSPAGLEARQWATNTDHCRRFVLKPQREGGGNNLYRTAIPTYLHSIPDTHWPSYILMEMIDPPPVHNTILRNGYLEQGGVICELGIYGACLWSQTSGQLLHNEEAGYLLRTKGDQSEEGGVAAGFGCMDSLYPT